MEICKNLVRLAVKAFYEPKDVIVIDLIIYNPGMGVDQLAGALGLTIKETQKVYGRLSQDKIITSITRWEEYVDPNAEMVREKRKVSKSYFYIDYPYVINLIKYKMVTIENNIKQEEEKTRTLLPYRCPVCDKEYSTLDCFALSRTIEGVFLCEICSAELIADQTDTDVTNERYIRFKNESKPIIDLLKLTDSIVIPNVKPILPEPGQAQTPKSEEKELEIKASTGTPTNQVVVEFENTNEPEHQVLDDYYQNLQQDVPLQVPIKRELEQDSDEDEEFEQV